MHTSILSIQNELDKARERLKGVEENIKKSIGRDFNQNPGLPRLGFKRGVRPSEDGGEEGERKLFLNKVEGAKNRQGRNAEPWTPGLAENRSREHDFRSRAPKFGRPNSFGPLPPFNNLRGRSDDKQGEERIPVKKRLGEQAITVFSRLSGPPKDEEMEEEPGVKVSSQVIVQDAPSRKEVLAAQSGDNNAKERNKRMFGALLGTLQKFRQEENKLKEKEEKRAQVEKKLEEAAQREKEEARKARQELFSNRRRQQLEIRQLEYKLSRIKQLSEWESTKVHLLNFIQTKAAPKIFYLPKTHNSKTQELLTSSRANINKMIEDKREEVEKAIAEHMPELGRRKVGLNRGVAEEEKKTSGGEEEEEEEEEEGEVEEGEVERDGDREMEVEEEGETEDQRPPPPAREDKENLL